jgi:hypothetical protein
MNMCIVLTVILWVFAILFCLLLGIICAPFQVVANAGYRNYSFDGSALFSFIHPKIIAVKFDLSSRSSRLRILGRDWTKRKKREKVKKRPEVTSPPNVSDGPLSEEPDKRHYPPEEKAPSRVDDSEELDDGTFGDDVAVKGREEKLHVPEDEYIDHTELETKLFTLSDSREKETDSVVKPHAVPPTEPSNKHTPPQNDSEAEGMTPTESNEELGRESDTPHTESSSEKQEEKVESFFGKLDNWLTQLERNRYLFFLRNRVWRTKVIRWLLRIIRTLFHIIRFDRFQLNVCAGVKDPAMVGTVNGWYQGLLYGMQLKKPYAFTFTPIFMRNHFEGSVRLRVGTSIVRLLVPLVVAIFTMPLLHTLWLVFKLFRNERAYKRLAGAV